jgi:Fur family ferric uptake transcriptional regulator
MSAPVECHARRWPPAWTEPEAPVASHLEDVRQEVRALLRAKGLRATSSRIDVLVALHESARPLTHEHVMESLRGGVYDKASVWRILSDLSDSGILRRMDLGDRVWRYELYDQCRSVLHDHAHFLCEECGDVQCLPPLVLQTQDGALPAALSGAEYRIRVMGRCTECVA